MQTRQEAVLRGPGHLSRVKVHGVERQISPASTGGLLPTGHGMQGMGVCGAGRTATACLGEGRGLECNKCGKRA